MNLPIQNISNLGSTIFLFCREKDNSLKIIEDKKFLPYFYEPTSDKESDAVSIFGEPLKKIYCTTPGEVYKMKSSDAYEADVSYCKRYILDKINKFEKSNPRILFLDIEVDAKELPHPKEDGKLDDSITVIRFFDNYTQKYKSWRLDKWDSEYNMLEDFCQVVKKLSPDIITCWNSSFDYFCLFHRIEDFPKKISPINSCHWRKGCEMPAGVSIVDMMGLYAKYTLHKKDSYALMNVANDELNYDFEDDFDFTDINIADGKNKLDVEKMVKLNEKLKLFDYFDEIRLISRCDWEDLPSEMRAYQWQSNNSKIIDMLALEEAKKLNVVLPSKKTGDDIEKGDVEGAFRETFGTGLYKNLAKVDLSGAYPQAIIDFSLSPENYKIKSNSNTIKIDVLSRETQELKETYYVEQNQRAILPVLTSRLLTMKNELKKELNSLIKDTLEHKQCQIAYDSRKALVNSAFGVFGMPFFRLYDEKVANCITFLVRDLLHFIDKKLNDNEIKVQYFDTDSVFYHGKEDITEQLNEWAIEWAMDRYNNNKINITFDFEGFFSSIFIQALCRYRGRLETSKGQKIETKGIQMKRKDTSKWVKNFQEKLYDKILDGNYKEIILSYIKNQIEDMKQANIKDIALPVKINKKVEDYKTTPKWLKPLEEAQKLVPEFNKTIGDRFYIIYCKSVEKIALGNKYYEHIKREDIDWNAMLEKNIFNILVPIFKGLNWSIELLELAESYGIILNSQYRNKLLEELDNFEELKEYYSARIAKKRIKEIIKNTEPINKVRKVKPLKINKIQKNKGSESSEKS